MLWKSRREKKRVRNTSACRPGEGKWKGGNSSIDRTMEKALQKKQNPRGGVCYRNLEPRYQPRGLWKRGEEGLWGCHPRKYNAAIFARPSLPLLPPLDKWSGARLPPTVFGRDTRFLKTTGSMTGDSTIMTDTNKILTVTRLYDGVLTGSLEYEFALVPSRTQLTWH